MKIAIDSNSLDLIKKSKEHEFIYIYDKEDLNYLINLNLHCIQKDYVKSVDINLTKYDLNCKKKAKPRDEDCLYLAPKKDYKFAIIIPNCNNDHGEYNGKTFFRNCIESVLNQTYKDFELIIVDDMSTDTSVQTIQKYTDKRIHLIQNKRKRYNGGSRNVGIDYALENLDFDYFCFLDSDDFFSTNKALEIINNELYDDDLMLIGLELLFPDGHKQIKYHQYDNYKDFFLSDNKVWCTAWSRIIKKDKIVHFCEDTLMEDRVWSYLQADNVDFNKVRNLKQVLYTWNRTNTNNSVSLVQDAIWNASAYCHIGHQLQLIEKIKHKEMIPFLKKRIDMCIEKVKNNKYQQY